MNSRISDIRRESAILQVKWWFESLAPELPMPDLNQPIREVFPHPGDYRRFVHAADRQLGGYGGNRSRFRLMYNDKEVNSLVLFWVHWQKRTSLRVHRLRTLRSSRRNYT